MSPGVECVGRVSGPRFLCFDGIICVSRIALGLALPELALLGVVVLVRRGEGLLAAALPHESEFGEEGEEEEDTVMFVSAGLIPDITGVLTVQQSRRQSKPSGVGRRSSKMEG